MTGKSQQFQEILRTNGKDLVKESVNFLKMYASPSLIVLPIAYTRMLTFSRFNSQLAVIYLPLASQIVDSLAAFVMDSQPNKKAVVSSQV